MRDDCAVYWTHWAGEWEGALVFVNTISGPRNPNRRQNRHQYLANLRHLWLNAICLLAYTHTLARLGFLAPAPEIQSAWSLWQPLLSLFPLNESCCWWSNVFYSRPGALHTLTLHSLHPQMLDRKVSKMRAYIFLHFNFLNKNSKCTRLFNVFHWRGFKWSFNAT